MDHTSPIDHDDLNGLRAPVTMFGPDFPFAYDDWLRHPAGSVLSPATSATL